MANIVTTACNIVNIMRMTFILHRITYCVVYDRSTTPSSLKFQHLQNYLKITHTSCLRLLPHLTVPSSFPSITCFRKQFLHKMWPIQFVFLICNVCRIFPSSLTLCNTTSFLTRSVQLIFSIPHFKSLLLFQINFPKCTSLSTIQSYTPNAAFY